MYLDKEKLPIIYEALTENDVDAYPDREKHDPGGCDRAGADPVP